MRKKFQRSRIAYLLKVLRINPRLIESLLKMSYSNYKWGRILDNPKVVKKLEKLLRLKGEEIDEDYLNNLVCSKDFKVKEAELLFHLDTDEDLWSGWYGSSWSVIKWLGYYFFNEGSLVESCDDPGPFKTIEEAFGCAYFPTDEENDGYLFNSIITSSLPLKNVLRIASGHVTKGHRIIINEKSYIRIGNKLNELKSAKLGEVQHGWRCVGFLKSLNKNKYSNRWKDYVTKHWCLKGSTAWLAKAINELNALKQFSVITGESYSEYLPRSINYDMCELQAYLGVIIVKMRDPNGRPSYSVWSRSDNDESIEEWDSYYDKAIKSIKAKIPQKISADKISTAGNDPIKLAHLLVDTGVFPKGANKIGGS